MSNSTPNNTVNTPLPHYRSHVTTMAQVTSLVVLGVVIVLGNLASIVTFIKTQSLRKRSNYLIIHLCGADILVGVVDFMSAYFFLIGPQVRNSFMISLELLDSLSGMASLLILATIAAERFHAIISPFKHRILPFKYYVTLFTLPWLPATAVSLIYLIGVTMHPPPRNLIDNYLLVRLVVLSLGLLVIVFSYTAIWIRTQHISHSKTSERKHDRRLHVEKKLAVTLSIVTLVSLLTWLPLQCFTYLHLYCKSCSVPHINIFFVMKFLQMANSGLNIFIYMMRMREYRVAFLRLFCGLRSTPGSGYNHSSFTSHSSLKTREDFSTRQRATSRELSLSERSSPTTDLRRKHIVHELDVVVLVEQDGQDRFTKNLTEEPENTEHKNDSNSRSTSNTNDAFTANDDDQQNSKQQANNTNDAFEKEQVFTANDDQQNSKQQVNSINDAFKIEDCDMVATSTDEVEIKL